MQTPEAAAEWHDVDKDTFDRVIRPRGRPAVLRGIIRDWPAVTAGRDSSRALAAYLKTFYTGHPVPSFEGPAHINGRFFYNDALDGFNFESKRMALDELLDRLCVWQGMPAPPALYAGSVSLPLYLPGFTADNHARRWLRDVSMLESIWIGNRTCIAAHFDNTDNLACVVAGSRRFTLFPPEQIENLYLGPLDRTPAGQPVSLVDIRAPDLARFPRYAEARSAAQIAHLGAGDAIYIPALWWHHVEALDDFNVLVNYWWREVADHVDSPSMTLLHALLTLKSLPVEQRLRWRSMFDYLIFQPDRPALEHLSPEQRGMFGDLTPDVAQRLRELLTKSLSRHRA